MLRASTPEDLDVLLEDAFVLRDAACVSNLFEADAVLVAGHGRENRGRAQIEQAADQLWNRAYVADVQTVLQVRDTALIIGESAINVAHRGRNGSWRFAIAILH